MPIHTNNDQEIDQSVPRKHVRLTEEQRALIVDYAVDRGKTFKETAEALDIPPQTVSHVVKSFNKYGDTHSRAQNPPEHRVLNNEHIGFLRNELEENCLLTNKELVSKLEEQFGLRVHEATIARNVKREHFTLSRVYDQVKTENSKRVLDERKQWVDEFSNNKIPTKHIFYVDECGFRLYQHQTHGRVRKRVYSSVSGNQTIRPPNFTLIAAIGIQGVLLSEVKMSIVTDSDFVNAMSKFLDVLEENHLVQEGQEGLGSQLASPQPYLLPVNTPSSPSSSSSSSSSSVPPKQPEVSIESEENRGVSFPLDKHQYHYKAWVVLDNASIHKTEEVRQLFAQRGFALVYLPPYSSFFNPMESCFNKIKSAFKRDPLDPGETVSSRIRDAALTLTEKDCADSIEHVTTHYKAQCEAKQPILE